MRRMRLLIVPGLVLLSTLTIVAKSKEEKQAEARKKADATLQRLYKAKPSAQAAVQSAAGYAVFNSGGAAVTSTVCWTPPTVKEKSIFACCPS